MPALIIIWVAMAIVAVPVAISKNRDAVGWFFICGIFGVFGLFALAAMPALEQVNPATNMDKDVKACPACAETIWATATKCRYCGAETPTDIAA